ncbi:MAG: TIGR04282 family arsenosugar biosynthesis glycosyltransferase [Spirochaetales bacterium]|nr:TIGR04282 family arsenosugar biosynthesis glycosyltransferase [Spirochaetales bacterium]
MDGSRDKRLIVFIKAPVIGKAKTRLASSLGHSPAIALYKAMITDLIRNIQHNQYTIMYYLDDIRYGEALTKLGIDKKNIRVQTGIDLGEKMSNAMDESFREKACSVLLIGSDIPYLDSSLMIHYFTHLRKFDMAIGPAYDGGYYCIGFRNTTFHSAVFKEITWSTPDVFKTTLAKAKKSHIQVYEGPYCRDIDTIEDLQLVVEDNTLQPKIPDLLQEMEKYRKID